MNATVLIRIVDTVGDQKIESVDSFSFGVVPGDADVKKRNFIGHVGLNLTTYVDRLLAQHAVQLAEAERVEEEKKKAAEQKKADEQKAADAKKKADEQKAADAKKKADEQKAADAKKKAEEEKRNAQSSSPGAEKAPAS